VHKLFFSSGLAPPRSALLRSAPLRSALLLAALLPPGALVAQQTAESGNPPVTLPDARQPQFADVSSVDSSSSQVDQAPQTSAPVQTATPAQDESPEQRRALAAAQLKAEESQRMAGIIPNFMAVNSGKALPISPGQKFQLFFKGSVDSYQFALAGIDALIGQAENSDQGYHQGLKGFARRYGANYADNFDGNFWGNAVLPSLLHQDPRYFRMGHGPILKRTLYSISTTFRTHGDNGNWQPNVSNLLGNLIGASISNLYYPNYPDNEQGLYPTLRRGLSVTYQGTIGGLLEEFYPDISDHFKRRHQAKIARQAAISQESSTPE
jgi:hypothetical protein